MTIETAIAPPRARWAVLPPSYLAMAWLLLLSLAVRWPYLGDPAPDYDEQLYSLVGIRMLEGAVPYVDIWDRKPYGLFLLFAAIHWVGGPHPLAYQAAAVVFAAFGGWLVFRIARVLSDGPGAVLSGALYIIGLTLFRVQSGQSEVFYLPVALGMLLLTIPLLQQRELTRLQRGSAAIMLLGGVLLQLKYTALPQCLFFGATCLWLQWRAGANLGRLVRFAAAAALLGIVPTLLVALYYLRLGAIESFAYANFLSIFERGGLSAEYMAFYGMIVAICAFPYVALALAGMVRARRALAGRPRAVWVLVALWTLANVIGFAMIGNIYIHYFAPVLPGLILMASPFLGQGITGRVIGGLTLAFSLFLANFSSQIATSQSNRAGIARLTSLIAPHVDRQDACLFVFDGPTQLYRTTGSCLPTRYVYPDHLSNSMEADAIGTDSVAELKRVLASRPAVIVTASKPVVPRYNPQAASLIEDAVTRDYRRIGSVSFFPRHLHVNLRRDLTAAP
ncbi:hypothetical protein [Qipengyuania sediminis]|uniref:hypothetical protein n=1 Tax=Qipengyuania sediminis TaxID=1532023 RepID=UPI00105A1154|nr:hypothetical protein [Qipengyuania sediminis]